MCTSIYIGYACVRREATNPAILFEQIDGLMIRSTALKTNGAAGPSGLDAAAWKRLCSSFQSSSADLCDAMASIAKRFVPHLLTPKALPPPLLAA